MLLFGIFSCAERGIRNALLAAGQEGSARGVIVPSNGNMAMAAAYHGGILGVPVILTPSYNPGALNLGVLARNTARRTSNTTPIR